MSSLRFILSSLRHHWRIHLAVALGVIAATGVLTGALLVGDSVRGSLRQLAFDRLGRIDEVLLSEQFFRAELADELSAGKDFQKHYAAAVPAILLQGTVEAPRPDATRRSGGVTVIGSDDRFWQLDREASISAPPADGVVLNEPLATELRAAVGDEVLLRIPQPSGAPPDTPLGEKTDTLASVRLTVTKVIPAAGLGRFGLRPSQQLPGNAYVAMEVLQNALEQDGRANAIFVAGTDVANPSSPAGSAALAAALAPRPTDLGLSIESVTIGPQEDPTSRYINVTSTRMLLPKPVVAAALAEFPQAQPALTYLANTLAVGAKKVPYSTVTGVDHSAELGPWPAEIGPLAEDELILNSWAAEQLAAEVGDRVAIKYYEPESTHGQLVEPPPATFRVRAIAALAEPGEPPTRANDPHFTPELRGVTDQASIDDWDLPFELTERIRRVDEDYWDDHRGTPKAFVRLDVARTLWSSRFGDTTSVRIPGKDLTPEEVFAALDVDPAAVGLEFRPVKRLALAASSGTTPFDLLFLGFSFFIIAAAVMLTMLLFRLGVQQRAEQIGILDAVGLPRWKIARLLLCEGAVVAAVGGLLGVAVGIAYAWLMLAGLRTWWLAAVSTPFLYLHITWLSLVLGFTIGVVISLLTIRWALRELRAVSTGRLLAGEATKMVDYGTSAGGKAKVFAWLAIIAAMVLAGSAWGMSGEAQAGAFFGSGSLVLIGALTLLWIRLRRGGQQARRLRSYSLERLAWRNGARNPSRSTLTIALVAAASFLIVAISAFRLDTTVAGTGGYTLVASTSQAIIHDLNSDNGRFELAFSDEESRLLEPSTIYGLRVQAGDDASCLNLYQSQQPRVLGVPPAMIAAGGFAWAATAAETDAEQINPWLLLNKPTASGAVPVVLDRNTAMYSLHLYGGVGQQYEINDPDAGRVTFEVVGLLQNSMFQGDLLIGEAQFLAAFPRTSGYRFFLVGVPPESRLQDFFNPRIEELEQEIDKTRQQIANQPDRQAILEPRLAMLETRQQEYRDLAASRDAYVHRVAGVLETNLGDWGFDAESAQQRLANFLAVQNTYLSTFQSLGALGLLLGTFGLATVQLRSVLQRRGELALMRAAGFRRLRLAQLVLFENLWLLAAGLGIGVLAALVAVAPHMLQDEAQVPWRSLLPMLAAIFFVGVLASLASVRATLRAPLLTALRDD